MLHSALGAFLWKGSVNHFFLIIAVYLFRFVLSQAPCYSPNGSILPDEVPCYTSAEVSVCCGRGWTCLSNSVCMLIQNSDFPDARVGSTYHSSCTDASWKSPKCPNFCKGVYQFNLSKTLEFHILWYCSPSMRHQSSLVDFHSWPVLCKKVILITQEGVKRCRHADITTGVAKV